MLYLLHGHTDDHAAWTRFTGLERFVRELNLAVVMPTVHNGFYTNTEIGYRYFDFCTQELPALVGSMFHVSTARRIRLWRAVQGGYGAWRLAPRLSGAVLLCGEYVGRARYCGRV